jgi:hypothetical protein
VALHHSVVLCGGRVLEGRIFQMNKKEHVQIEEYRQWLLSQEEHYRRNPQVARTYQECREKLENILRF